MENSAKKVTLTVVAVVCLVAAGVIAYMTLGGKSNSTGGAASNTKLWVKCNNPKCDYEGQMDRAEFSKLAYAKGPRYTASFGALPVKCPKCTEDSVFAAIKCEKCGKVFFASTVEGPYDDKCPACEYSKKEEAAKQQTKPVKK